MTDLEYVKLSFLFERKRFRLDQIMNLLEWVDKYDDDTGQWSAPSDLINTLTEFYPDR